MFDANSLRARADFSAARTKALFREILALITGRDNELLSFDDVALKLHVGGPIYRGVRAVLLEQVIGSVNRYQDFDRAFLPTQTHTAERWQRVSRAWYDEISLPPVLLYKVGDIYFVVDGHHRVSVARDQGQAYIDAEVRECQVKVPVTRDLQSDDLVILGAKVEFLDRTNLDRLRPAADVTATILGGYDRMLEHIAVHRYFMGLDFKRDVAEGEAVEHWYDIVYLPVVRVVRENDIMQAFPSRTEADFYLWVMDHRHYLVSQGKADLVEPGRAAEEFVEHYLSGKVPPSIEGAGGGP